MTSSHHRRITVALQPGADPIRGVIERPDGRRLRFWGWLELIEELRRVAAAGPPNDAALRAEPKPPTSGEGKK